MIVVTTTTLESRVHQVGHQLSRKILLINVMAVDGLKVCVSSKDNIHG